MLLLRVFGTVVASRWREIFQKIYKLQILRRFVKDGVKQTKGRKHLMVPKHLL